MGNVSVVMPARNAAQTIAASVRSVLEQDALRELVVVNDGSTDATCDILETFQDPRLRIIAGPEQGIAAALNAGVDAALGPFIARCDADDLFMPGRVARQSEWLTQNAGFVAITGGFISMDDAGSDLAQLACDGEKRDVTECLIAGQPQSHLCAWLFRRDAFLSIGGARHWFETAEDIDLQYRLAFTGRVWHDPAPVYRYRLHDTSITHTRRSAQLAFFDQMARDFAIERRRTGTDALERHCPPQIPPFEKHETTDRQLQSQIIGHLTSQAWHDFENGYPWCGLHRLFLTIRKAPFSARQWRALTVMALKSVARMYQKK